MSASATLPLTLLWALVGGYVLGSIPFGLVLTRMAGLGDIRAIGSGNIGATNVLRTGRKSLAAATLAADALKGTIAVLVASRWGQEAALAAAAGAFLGHVFPAWLGFRGGKGMATFLGVLIAVDAWVALAAAVAWLAVAAAFRYSSLASLSASALTPLAFFWLGQTNAGLLFAIMTVTLWFRHRLNLTRLRAGTEGRIGQKG